IAVVGEDTENEVTAGLGRPGVNQAEEIVKLFEQAYQRGDATLFQTKAAVAPKPAKGGSAATAGSPAEYEWRPANRREEAVKEAFERVATTLGIKAELDDAPKEAGQHKAELDRQAKEELTKAREFHAQHKRDMAA